MVGPDLSKPNEIRKDYRTGRMCIIAPNRGNKPSDLKHEETRPADISDCPFEPENDGLNREVMKVGDPWIVRVIKNAYPALVESTPLMHKDGLLASISGYGYAEVVIDSPKHSENLEDIDDDRLMTWLNTIMEREETLYQKSYIKYVQIFRNYGALAGSSLSHPHTQILALPELPETIMIESKVAADYSERTGSCLYEDVLKQEVGRSLINTDTAVAIAPYASRFAAESLILPKRHVNYLSDLSEKEKKDVIHTLRTVLLTNRKLFGDISYTLVVHDVKDIQSLHMHLELYPSLETVGGLEFGEGLFVNKIAPEEYAEHFRKNVVST